MKSSQNKQFLETKVNIKLFFKKTKSVFVPALNETVVFNAKGVNHLIYKGNRSRRSFNRIKTNLRLLPRAVKLLKSANFYQEESSYLKSGRKYHFWAFEAVVDNRRIKVVVRQVGNGRKHFWSVIPAWRKNRFGVLNAKSKNLEKEA